MTGLCRRVFRRGALAIAMLALGSEAHATPRFDSWAIEDGLPQNSVNDILQTPRRLSVAGDVRRPGALRRGEVRGLRPQRRGCRKPADPERCTWIERARSGLRPRMGCCIRHRDGRFRTFTSDDGLPQAVAFRIEEDAAGSPLDYMAGRRHAVRRGALHQLRSRRFPAGRSRAARGPAIPAGGGHPCGGAWTAEGLQCLRAGEVRTCLTRDQLPAAEIAGVTMDWRGALWIHTDGCGFDPDRR